MATADQKGATKTDGRASHASQHGLRLQELASMLANEQLITRLMYSGPLTLVTLPLSMANNGLKKKTFGCSHNAGAREETKM
jgi:hypothetical protein